MFVYFFEQSHKQHKWSKANNIATLKKIVGDSQEDIKIYKYQLNEYKKKYGKTEMNKLLSKLLMTKKIQNKIILDILDRNIKSQDIEIDEKCCKKILIKTIQQQMIKGTQGILNRLLKMNATINMLKNCKDNDLYQIICYSIKNDKMDVFKKIIELRRSDIVKYTDNILKICKTSKKQYQNVYALGGILYLTRRIPYIRKETVRILLKNKLYGKLLTNKSTYNNFFYGGLADDMMKHTKLRTRMDCSHVLRTRGCYIKYLSAKNVKILQKMIAKKDWSYALSKVINKISYMEDGYKYISSDSCIDKIKNMRKSKLKLRLLQLIEHVR